MAGRMNVAIQTIESTGGTGADAIGEATRSADALTAHFSAEAGKNPGSAGHYRRLAEETTAVRGRLGELQNPSKDKYQVAARLKDLQGKLPGLSAQPPVTLFRLRATEIGLPMLLCLVTLWLLKFYPLTEERSYEIKAILKKRHQELDPVT